MEYRDENKDPNIKSPATDTESKDNHKGLYSTLGIGLEVVVILLLIFVIISVGRNTFSLYKNSNSVETSVEIVEEPNQENLTEEVIVEPPPPRAMLVNGIRVLQEEVADNQPTQVIIDENTELIDEEEDSIELPIDPKTLGGQIPANMYDLTGSVTEINSEEKFVRVFDTTFGAVYTVFITEATVIETDGVPGSFPEIGIGHQVRVIMNNNPVTDFDVQAVTIYNVSGFKDTL